MTANDPLRGEKHCEEQQQFPASPQRNDGCRRERDRLSGGNFGRDSIGFVQRKVATMRRTRGGFEVGAIESSKQQFALRGFDDKIDRRW